MSFLKNPDFFKIGKGGKFRALECVSNGIIFG